MYNPESVKVSERLPNRKHELLAGLISTQPELTKVTVSKTLKCSESHANKLLHSSHIIRRAAYLRRRRISTLAAKAITALEDLLGCDDPRVRLGAAKDILDRAGYVAPQQEVQPEKPTFAVVLNLGEHNRDTHNSHRSEVALKTGPSTLPSDLGEEFLGSRETKALRVTESTEGEAEDGRDQEEAYQDAKQRRGL